MRSIGASKVSLSSLSSEALWQRSGRLDKSRSSELLRLQDRKGAKYLLSPTHEEEITTIIANAVRSYKELPLRLYQVTRKYRDEPRPRQGLLRGREFLMKDLYTFDADEASARLTYEEVCAAYIAFLQDLKLPFLVAQADSGNMGGTLSHEYHFVSPQGEDTIITCDTCDLSMNEELWIGRPDPVSSIGSGTSSLEIATSHYVSKDRKALCSIHYPVEYGEPNIYAVKAIFPDVDTGVESDAARKEYDGNVANSIKLEFKDPRLPIESLAQKAGMSLHDAENLFRVPVVDGEPILLTRPRQGDTCPNCSEGKLHLHSAVEIGHTFHLGQRYSVPLDAQVLNEHNQKVPVEMGCHGIGVSRLIGAIAALLADDKGLNWPLAIAPFETVIVTNNDALDSAAASLYDRLSGHGLNAGRQKTDLLIDDRSRALGWKLNDADLVGYPFIIVMGKGWDAERKVELQCRRLGVKEEVPVDEVATRMRLLSDSL